MKAQPSADTLAGAMSRCYVRRVPTRSSSLLRIFTVAFVLIFAFNASHAASSFKPSTCAHCPPDCPMHKSKRKCHDTPGKGVHCKRSAAKAPGLYPSGCKSRADGFTTVDQPSLLAPAVVLGEPLCCTLMIPRQIGEHRAGFCRPHLHPPSPAPALA